MSGDYLLHVGAQLSCLHSGTGTIQADHPVKVNGQSVVTANDTFSIAGCPFQVPVPSGTKLQPCISIQWLVPATRVKVNKQAVLLKSSSALCQSAEQISQGAPNVTMTQERVKGV